MLQAEAVDVAVDGRVEGEAAAVEGPRWGLIAFRLVFAVGLVLRLTVAVLPERLLLRITVDDALYYVRVAQELATGGGSSFDGIHTTNGYHPLWLVIITPFTALFGDGTGLLRVLVVLQTLLSAATFLVVARVLRPRLGAAATAVGLSMWWVTPHSVLGSQSGVESALAGCAVAVLVLAAVRCAASPTPRAAALVGAAAGVAFLARSDTAFASIAVGLWLLHTTRRAPEGERLAWRHAVALLSSGIAVVLPWLGWNLIRFGTIEQASTWARPMVMWDLAERADPAASQVSIGLSTARQYLTDQWPLTLGWTPLTAVLVLVVLATLVRRGAFADPAIRRLAVLSGSLLLAGTVLAAVHSGVRLVPREYYFEWVRMALGMLAATMAAGLGGLLTGRERSTPLVNRESRRWSPVLLGIALVLVLLVPAVRTVRALSTPTYRWQSSMVDAGRWLASHTGEDARVLSFNAGIISHYSQRDVVNLDGVINNGALEALRSRDLAAYMCSTGAEWYADFHPRMVDEHERFLGPDAARLRLDPVAYIRAEGAGSYGGSELIVSRFSCTPD